MAEVAGRPSFFRAIASISQVRGQPAPVSAYASLVRRSCYFDGSPLTIVSPAPPPSPAEESRVSRAFLSGLRGRLLLLVVLATLPAFALSFYASWRDRQHQVCSAWWLDTVASGAACWPTTRSASSRARGRSCPTSATSRRSGPATRSARGTLFALLMKQWRGYASFTLIDAAGTPAGEPARRPMRPVDFSDRPWFQRAIATGALHAWATTRSGR